MESLSLTTLDGVALELRLAGAGSRAYAFLIDWHIRVLAAAVLGFGGPLLLSLSLGDAEDGFGGAAIALWLLAGAVYLLYHPLLEVLMHGRTPGKRWAQLRVVAHDGSPAAPGALLVRNLFRLVDSLPGFYALGLTVMLLRRAPLRIGDLAAGTCVVYDAADRAGDLAAAARWSQRLSPQGQQVLQEWLARWNELGATRDAIARAVLARTPGQAAAAQLSDEALRDHVRSLLA